MEKDKNQIIESSVSWYISNRLTYKKLCAKIESIIIEILEINKIPFHAITSRTKEVESYRKKISDEKYDDPIQQITDYSGIRIITYVEDDVKKACEVLENIFYIDKDRSLDKSKSLGVDKVGYKSVHYICKLKDDRTSLPEYRTYDNLFFEIQVRTILQHAWAEIEHDRNYKFSGILPEEISRRFKLVAGSLEIADREFNNIAKEIDELSSRVAQGTQSGNLDFEINSTSLMEFIKNKFEYLLEQGRSIDFESSEIAVSELTKFGIKYLNEFNDILTEKKIKDVTDYVLFRDNELNTMTGMIRLILIITDYDKYFSQAYNKKWLKWSGAEHSYDIFKKYDVDWQKINEKYNVSEY